MILGVTKYSTNINEPTRDLYQMEGAEHGLRLAL